MRRALPAQRSKQKARVGASRAPLCLNSQLAGEDLLTVGEGEDLLTAFVGGEGEDLLTVGGAGNKLLSGVPSGSLWKLGFLQTAEDPELVQG